MAYIININPTGAVTIELSQGRVQLDPLKYCELHPQDIERALKVYNNAQMGLYVAETDKELTMILEGNKSVTKNDEEDTEPVPDSDPNSVDPQSQNVVLENSNENIPETTTEVETETEETVNENSTNETKTEEPKAAENTEDAIKKQIIDSVEKYRAAGNLNALKELASKLKISFMYNISLNTLANKIIESIK